MVYLLWCIVPEEPFQVQKPRAGAEDVAVLLSELSTKTAIAYRNLQGDQISTTLLLTSPNDSCDFARDVVFFHVDLDEMTHSASYRLKKEK